MPTGPLDRLALLYRVSQAVNSSLDLDTVLNQVIDAVIAATRAERGFVMLRDDDGEWTSRVARGMDQKTIDEPKFQVSRSVIERVALEGQPILASDARADARLSQRQSVVMMGLRSILCVPIQTRGKTTGVVYVDNRFQTGIFTPDELELLTSIAATAAIAIENARLYQIAVERGRIERELQMAHEVQASLLPRETPQIPGWEFAARWIPAREVAGDYYDFIPDGRGGMGLLVADVADKGMPAALFMTLTRSIIRGSLASLHSPAEVFSQANRLISADAADGMFVTLFFAHVLPSSGEITYVNAGHNPPLLYRAADKRLATLKRTALPLGIDADAPCEQRAETIEAGDALLLYTDGVTDAMDSRGDRFGDHRLEWFFSGHAHLPASHVVLTLESELAAFKGATDPFDDITVLVAKRV